VKNKWKILKTDGCLRLSVSAAGVGVVDFQGVFRGVSGGGGGGWARARRKTKANDQAIPKTNENKLCAVMQVQWS